MRKHNSFLILLVAGASIASELVWASDGYRLWFGLALLVVWVIVRNSHVFTTT